MATYTKLSSGSWRVQVRRKGRYVSETFLRRDDARRWATDAEAAAAEATDFVQPGDVVLVKASRALGLERVAEALAAVSA